MPRSTTVLERPSGVRRRASGVVARPHNPAHDKAWDRTMDQAMLALDRDDMAGFWDCIEDLNKLNTLRG